MPWYGSIIIGFLFIAGGVLQWGFSHQIENHYETICTNLVNGEGEIVAYRVNVHSLPKGWNIVETQK